MSSAGTTVARTGAEPARPSPWSGVVGWSAYGLVALAFIVLAFAAHSVAYFPLDLQAARAVQGIPVHWFHSVMWAISWAGFFPQGPIFIGIIAVGYVVAHQRRAALYVAVSGVGEATISQVVKMLVNRPRPPIGLIGVWDPGLNNAGWSFPAGHVESYVAVLGFIFFLAYMARGRTFLRAGAMIVMALLIVAIGVSRVDSGDHWLSDVVGGYLIGGLWLVALIYVYQRRAPAS